MTRRVLVTGGSRGIGKAMAIALAKSGLDVAINYLHNHDSARKTLELIHDLGGKASLLPFDVSDRKSSGAAIIADMEQHGVFWGVV
jgi:3-oxoacyl-[acyl-carrier protein] reductase